MNIGVGLAVLLLVGVVHPAPVGRAGPPGRCDNVLRYTATLGLPNSVAVRKYNCLEALAFE